MAKLPTIAIATAGVAVALSLSSLVVVATRTPRSSEPGLVVFETTVAATDVARLRDAVEQVEEAEGAIGVRVTDEQLRGALGLKLTDVISSLGGRPLHKEPDVARALIRQLDATTLYVDVIREGEPIVFRWKLDAALRLGQRSSTRDTPAPADPLLDEIIRVDDFHYVIPKPAADQLLADPFALAGGARVVPALALGKPQGFKLYAIRSSSIFAKLGFSNGDLVREINGFSIDSAERMLELYGKLKSATSFEIGLVRRGSEETIRIEIR